MRSNEEAMDYRYFPDPDLLPLDRGDGWFVEIRTTLPELPDAKHECFVYEYGLTPYEAGVLTGSRELADFFVVVVLVVGGVALLVVFWVFGVLFGVFFLVFFVFV